MRSVMMKKFSQLATGGVSEVAYFYFNALKRKTINITCVPVCIDLEAPYLKDFYDNVFILHLYKNAMQ